MNMSASTPHFAPLVVLLFLGTIFLLGTALLVLFCGAVRRSAFFAKLGAGAVATIASGYFLLLSGVSLASIWGYTGIAFLYAACYAAFALAAGMWLFQNRELGGAEG